MEIKMQGDKNTGVLPVNNEDFYIVEKIFDHDHILAVVIDGVGGQEGGEVAAELAAETIRNYLVTYSNGERESLLKEAVNEANNKIFQERERRPEVSKMSCVLTACLIEISKRKFHLAHVGDTRMYQIAHGELKKITHDHSMVGYREETGRLTELEAMNHPQRNIILRDVGSELHKINDEDFIETGSFVLLDNSSLLLCSDGLSDMLTSAEIIEELNSGISIEDRVKGLIDAANNKGGLDNITVVLIEMDPDYDVIPHAIIAGPKEDSQLFAVSDIDNEAPVSLELIPENSINEPLNSNIKKTGILKVLLWLLIVLASMAIGWFGHRFLGENRKDDVQSLISNPVIVAQPTNRIDTSIQMQLDSFARTSGKDTFSLDKDSIYITKEITIKNNKTIWIQKKPLFIINKGQINLIGIVLTADSCVFRNLRFIGFKDSINVKGKKNIIK